MTSKYQARLSKQLKRIAEHERVRAAIRKHDESLVTVSSFTMSLLTQYHRKILHEVKLAERKNTVWSQIKILAPPSMHESTNEMLHAKLWAINTPTAKTCDLRSRTSDQRCFLWGDPQYKKKTKQIH